MEKCTYILQRGELWLFLLVYVRHRWGHHDAEAEGNVKAWERCYKLLEGTNIWLHYHFYGQASCIITLCNRLTLCLFVCKILGQPSHLFSCVLGAGQLTTATCNLKCTVLE